MQIELKNIVPTSDLDQHLVAFAADLYVNGFKVAHVEVDEDRRYSYSILKKQTRVFNSAASYLKRKDKKEFPNSHPMDAIQHLNSLVGDLGSLHFVLLKRSIEEENRWKELVDKSIVYGKSRETFDSYPLYVKVERLLAIEAGREKIAKVMKNYILPNLKPGERILNPNIPSEFLKPLLSARGSKNEVRRKPGVRQNLIKPTSSTKGKKR